MKVVKWLTDTFAINTEDVRSSDNDALLHSCENGQRDFFLQVRMCELLITML